MIQKKGGISTWELFAGGVGCPALRDAVNKYGIDNFKFEVLIICFDDVRFEMEKLYIKKYNSQVPNGYNISAGGMGGNFTGRKHTPETLSRIIEKTKMYRENNPDWYEKIRDKHAAATSAALKSSEKFKKAVAEGRIGRKSGDGRKITDETREKVRKSLIMYYEKSRESSEEGLYYKPLGIGVIKYDTNNNIVDSFKSISEAARQNNMCESTLRKIIKKGKVSKGFIWKKDAT